MWDRGLGCVGAAPSLFMATLSTMSMVCGIGGGAVWELPPAFHGYTQHDAYGTWDGAVWLHPT